MMVYLTTVWWPYIYASLLEIATRIERGIIIIINNNISPSKAKMATINNVKKKKEESWTKKQLRHRMCLNRVCPHMADNQNSCLEAEAAVGVRERLTISR